MRFEFIRRMFYLIFALLGYRPKPPKHPPLTPKERVDKWDLGDRWGRDNWH